jgi:hypothetical protein
MSTEQLTARYEDAGIRNYATRFMGGDSEPWDLELDNRIIEELIAVVAELRARGAVAALLPLLDHANVAVRGFAAGACLAVAPERAVPVLEAIIAEEGSLDEGRASWALRRWRDDGLPRR